MSAKPTPRFLLVTTGFVLAGLIAVVGARQQANAAAAQAAAQAAANRVAIDNDDIGGVVSSANGPEAGVWVIAETSELQTMFRREVVTDDQGRYVVPDLPKANYKVWVRGYGLVDSAAVTSSPGQHVALTAVVAPNPRAAAQVFPANYWVLAPAGAAQRIVPDDGDAADAASGSARTRRRAWRRRRGGRRGQQRWSGR